jgi:hypothetical protein
MGGPRPRQNRWYVLTRKSEAQDELTRTSQKFEEKQESARREDSFTRFKAQKSRGALVISVSSAMKDGPHVAAEARWYGMGSAICDDKYALRILRPSFSTYEITLVELSRD